MQPQYSIIIPTKNEEESIAKVLCCIPKKIKDYSEILVVDSSTDTTPIIANKLGTKVIRLKRSGKGRAMKVGVENSRGKILIFLDGDGTDPPEYIPKLLQKLKHANLVLGSRSLKDFKRDDLAMRMLFKINNLSIKPLFRAAGLHIKGDPLAGFRVIRRTDWENLELKSNDFAIEAEMNLKALENDFVIDEVAIPHLKRIGGLLNSKFGANLSQWSKIVNFTLKHIKNKKNKRGAAKFAK